jgi:signal transduction histidine kinase
VTSANPSIFDRRRQSLVGILTWAVVGVPFVITAIRQPSALGDDGMLISLAGYAVFLACFLVTGRVRDDGKHPPVLIAILAGQSLAAAAAGMFVFSGVFAPGGILTVITAAQLATLLPRAGWLWIVVQSLLLFIAYRLARWPTEPALFIALAFGAFQCFAFAAARIAEREAAARRQLADLNARLLDAQSRLAAAAATAERARLWRELHDVMGHHLAALSLNLEAAANLTDGRGQELVRHCRALSRLMLADIRSVLSEDAAPESAPPDIPHELANLGRAFPDLSVHTSIAPLDPPPSSAAAHAILRAAQECITNAARHGHARNIHLSLRADGARLIFEARDDGRGAATITPGSGLTHMRERMLDLGGQLECSSHPGEGFNVRATLPLDAPAPVQETAA